MESVLLLGVCAVAWLAWLPAVLAEKEARGEKPSTYASAAGTGQREVVMSQGKMAAVRWAGNCQ